MLEMNSWDNNSVFKPTVRQPQFLVVWLEFCFATGAVAEVPLLPLRGSRALEERYKTEEIGDQSFDLFIIATEFYFKMLGTHGFRVQGR